MANANDFFLHMCKEAQDELASGEKSWKEIETNTLVLACFGFLTNHLAHKLSKPLWFFASSIAAGIITYIVRSFLG
jgi:hypothetical protein